MQEKDRETIAALESSGMWTQEEIADMRRSLEEHGDLEIYVCSLAERRTARRKLERSLRRYVSAHPDVDGSALLEVCGRIIADLI